MKYILIFVIALWAEAGFCQGVTGSAGNGNTKKASTSSPAASTKTIGTSSGRKEDARNIFVITRKVEKEIPASSSPFIFINNNYNAYEIRTWDKNAVKVESVLSYDSVVSNGKATIIPKKQSFDFFSEGNKVTIKYFPSDPVTIYPKGQGQPVAGSMNRVSLSTYDNHKDMIIYIPIRSTVEIKGEFSVVYISHNLSVLKADLHNIQLEMADADSLHLVSKYSNVRLGNASFSSINFSSGTFKAGKINQLNLSSRFSEIEIDHLEKGDGSSENDNLEIDTVRSLKINKKFGQTRIGVLQNSLLLIGQNSDVKIKFIHTDADSVLIENSYASIDMPLSRVNNYAVDISGSNLTVTSPFRFDVSRSVSEADISRSKLENVQGLLRSANNVPIQLTYQHGMALPSSVFTKLRCSNCIINLK